jgi:ATP-dependent protease HslVU (ClpYQ) peptidase subunit
MTTIAYRNGVMASDSQTSVHTEEGGSRYFKCVKMYRKFAGTPEEVIIATAGETFSALVFVKWYGSGKDAPENLVLGDADFTAIVLSRGGVLTEYDKWCEGEVITEPFYAIGSGAKCALAAMHLGKSAARAVEVACLIDTYSRPPITVWNLSRLAADKQSKTDRKARKAVYQPSVPPRSKAAEPPVPATLP